MKMKQSPKKVKKPRVQSAAILECKGKVSLYWWPIPFDKKDRVIPTSVDCIYSQEYFSREEAARMLRSL